VTRLTQGSGSVGCLGTHREGIHRVGTLWESLYLLPPKVRDL